MSASKAWADKGRSCSMKSLTLLSKNFIRASGSVGTFPIVSGYFLFFSYCFLPRSQCPSQLNLSLLFDGLLFHLLLIFVDEAVKEDLIEYDKPELVRTICECNEIPIITGMGHSSDKFLCDDAAYWDAKTPTKAAEKINEIVRGIKSCCPEEKTNGSI